MDKLFFLKFDLFHDVINIILINRLLFLKLFINGCILKNIFILEVIAYALHHKWVLSEYTNTFHLHFIKFIHVSFFFFILHQLLFKIKFVTHCFSIYFINVFLLLFIASVLNSSFSLCFVGFWFLLWFLFTKDI